MGNICHHCMKCDILFLLMKKWNLCEAKLITIAIRIIFSYYIIYGNLASLISISSSSSPHQFFFTAFYECRGGGEKKEQLEGNY